MKIGSFFPWMVAAVENQYIPRVISVSVVCEAGVFTTATKSSKPFQVEFLGVDCTEKIMPKVLPLFPQVPYIPSSVTPRPIGDWSTFFTNSDTIACPISKCRLFQKTSEFTQS